LGRSSTTLPSRASGDTLPLRTSLVGQ
jgi:hypothetical protein